MIKPSNSPWVCGVLITKKKGDLLRLFCDFRYLKSVTVKDAYPIPTVDESLSKLGDAKFFTSFDLRSAFCRYHLEKKIGRKRELLASLDCSNGRRCHSTYAMRDPLMSQALTRKTKKYRNLVPCYVEDSLIATPTLEDHTKRLDEVFARIKSAGLNCKPSKCES